MSAPAARGGPPLVRHVSSERHPWPSRTASRADEPGRLGVDGTIARPRPTGLLAHRPAAWRGRWSPRAAGNGRERCRSAEQVALAERDAELAKHSLLGGLFDPLRDDHAARPARKVRQAGDHRLAGRIVVHVADEADVDLEEAGGQLD